jgi:hypothetical protein
VREPRGAREVRREHDVVSTRVCDVTTHRRCTQPRLRERNENRKLRVRATAHVSIGDVDAAHELCARGWAITCDLARIDAPTVA